MFSAVLIGLFAFLGIGGLVFKRTHTVTERERHRRGEVEETTTALPLYWAWIGSLAVAGIWAFFSTFTIVQGYEVGVPVAFGKVGPPLQSGVHFTAPWTKVETFPTRPLAVPDVEITARTAQGGKFDVKVGARWSVVPDKARDLYFQVRTGDEERISKDVVDKALGQAVGNVYSQMDNTTAISDRGPVEVALTTELQRLVDPYGIKVNTLFLRSAEPDEVTARAISSFTSQQQATRVAEESEKTAAALARSRQVEAAGIKTAQASLPTGLTDQQVQVLCMQSQERVAQAAIAKGVPVYALPCGGSATTIAK